MTPLPDLTIRIAEPGPDREACHAIRRAVFVVEQHVPPEIEFDSLDSAAIHLLALTGNAAVGCARMVDQGDRVRIGRVAVLPDARRRGIGSALVSRAVDYASSEGYECAVLHAQVVSLQFYKALGFAIEGDRYLEAGIPHITMSKALR